MNPIEHELNGFGYISIKVMDDVFRPGEEAKHKWQKMPATR